MVCLVQLRCGVWLCMGTTALTSAVTNRTLAPIR
jgi:hypothetical protein